MTAGSHLCFVWRATGYELVTRPGPPPAPGSEVDLGDEGGGRFVVARLGPSPLPADPRRCAYLEPA